LDTVFKADLPLREAQIIQDNPEHIVVRYVPIPNDTQVNLSVLKDRLKERLGNMEIHFEKVDKIPRSSNGKFRAVISNINMKTTK
jgi:phenylacetate-CoA ligase